MDRLKKQRKPLRSGFTKACTNLEKELSKPPDELDLTQVRILMGQLTEIHENLVEIQRKVEDVQLDDDYPEADYEEEVSMGYSYRNKYIALKAKVEFLMNNPQTPGQSESVMTDRSYSGIKKTFKLPKLELKKFSGDVRDWLTFWAQFSKIHEDKTIVPEDKFQYLRQAVVEGSRAASLVNSYPATKENYPKVIDQLKKRFARENLLVKVHVGELIILVMQNAARGRTRVDMTELYDKIESYIRALESLGRTRKDYADFLEPLVEACLPDDILRIWHRKRGESEDDSLLIESDEGSDTLLNKLMNFLRVEVNSEEMFKITQKFGDNILDTEGRTGYTKSSKNRKEAKGDPPTATVLLTSEPKKVKSSSNNGCVFCNKKHNSQDCYAARKMSMDNKRQVLMDKRCCLSCLKGGHFSKQCKANIRCIICEGRHFPIFCTELENKSSNLRQSREDSSPTQQMSVQVMNSLTTQSSHKRGNLPTLVAKAYHGTKSIFVRVLIDTAAETSYVTSSTVTKLNMLSKRELTLTHGLFGAITSDPVEHKIHKINLGNLEGTYNCSFDILETEEICNPISMIPRDDYVKLLTKANVKITKPPVLGNQVDVLIGCDVAGKLFTGKIVRLENNMDAMETRLGWVIMGKKENPEIQENAVATYLSLHVMDVSVSNLWKLDVLGIEDPAESARKSQTIQDTMVRFQETVKIMENGRYEVELPFKPEHPPLPSNKEIAWRRTQAMINKLDREGNLAKYSAIFSEWLEKGIIEEVPNAERNNFGHYLPHRPVVKEESLTTKIRPVFDASSHAKGLPSLNECVETGPNLIETIPSILDRFRSKPVGVIADIEKAFLQIEVSQSHRDYLRFFGTEQDQVFRHRRVVFGITSSPFLLGAVINTHIRKVETEFPETTHKLKESFYVDNCVTSVATVEELRQFVKESVDIMARAKMNLRCWESNCDTEYTTVDHRELPVLGMLWSLQQDTLKCDLSSVLNYRPVEITKRVILSTVHRVFDPIGATCPVTLGPRLMLQELWNTQIGWDDPVNEEFRSRFETWKCQLYLLDLVRIPRYTGSEENAELHVFVDASKDAFAACIFLRSKNKSGKTQLTFLRGKNRVAPLKRVTIPRLELLACCLGVRLATSIKQSLHQEDIPTIYWTDAMDALCWIKNDGKRDVFVTNRLKEIRQLSNREDWRHCPGSINPADLPSRGCTASKLLALRWWEGPVWLKGPVSDWPQVHPAESQVQVPLEAQIPVDHTYLTVIKEQERPWYLEYFSSYHRILRLVSWVRRVIYFRQGLPRKNELALEEIEEAETYLFREVQTTILSRIKGMDPNLVYQGEGGLWRIKTPIAYRDDELDFRHPIILSAEHPLVVRLIEHSHRSHCHAGPTILLGILREKFLIFGARRTVRKITRSCVTCLRHNSKPLSTPTVPLPRDRVQDACVFEVVGIDLAGPLILKGGEKVWIVLFSCAVYRALHLELVTNLSVEGFLQALRRFIARRGRPRIIYSDNGSNFVGAENCFKQIDWSRVLEYAEVQRILWRFNPPRAAWWGGFWERMVGVVKPLLRRVLGKASLNFEQLSTVLCDCESTVNSRPLTYMTDTNDELCPLTPAVFLQDHKHNSTPDIDLAEEVNLNRRAKHRRRITEQLRKRFRSEYLGQLKNYHSVAGEHRPVQLNEIVLVGDNTKHRINWPLGRVTDLYPGKDGLVRHVRVWTTKGFVHRPIQHLYPLEVRQRGCEVERSEGESTLQSESEGLTGRMVGENGPTTEEDPVIEKFTRSGRKTRKPVLFDLFNDVCCDEFNSH